MIEYKRDIEVLRDTIASAVQPIEGAVLAPAGYQLIATEQFGDIPTRLRGTYHAGSLADFAKYLDAYVDEGESVVFLSPDRVSARIDHGSMATPGWGVKKTSQYNHAVRVNYFGVTVKYCRCFCWVFLGVFGMQKTARS